MNVVLEMLADVNLVNDMELLAKHGRVCGDSIVQKFIKDRPDHENTIKLLHIFLFRRLHKGME